MPKVPLPKAIYIDTQELLDDLVDRLRLEKLIAVDTESNSLYAYQERVCLIQLSTRDQDYIIDPFSIDDLSPIGTLMSDPNIEKVFHAAEYDIACLKRDIGCRFVNLFDTMIAARICGLETYGLGNILERYFSIEVDKSHQLDDWGKRPLPQDSLIYAQMDTHFLPYLRDELYLELQKMGRLAEAYEAFEDTCKMPAAAFRDYDPEGFWRISRPNMVRQSELPFLRELYRLREQMAIEKDQPPFKVFSNKTLVLLAQIAPRSMSELRAIRGISSSQVREFGRRILNAVKQAERSREPLIPPDPPMPDPVVTERYAALHSWRKERATARGVESDVIISKQTLWDLANKAPRTVDDLHQIHGIGPWRLQTYGQEILDVLNTSKR